MAEDFDMESLLESMNLTGQSQPTTMPNVSDPSLDNQILNDLTFGSDAFLSLNSTSSDDIHNALIDSPSALFTTTPQHSFESEDIASLISSNIGEVPRQNSIEDTFEHMNINPLPTDFMLSSSFSTQVGSSPVEPQAFDNVAAARQCVRNQQRLHKNASKLKKNSAGRHTSSSVAPIDILASYGGCQPCSSIQINTEFDFQQQLLQFDSLDSKQIKIRCQPRKQFRPRTQNESKTATHYLRCEQLSEHEYPTIDISPKWPMESVNNIIEVTLVAKDKQPHCYTIDNRQCQPRYEENTLIFRLNEPQSLYFRVTPEDISKGYKSFMIEYIKGKQDDFLTKNLIKQRELEQSMLRFTRYFETEKDSFQRDEDSVAYSCVMTEGYGDVCVEHIGPQYGPICGNERVYAVLKGRVLKDDITVFVGIGATTWRQSVSFTKSGNVIYFSMPPFPCPQVDQGVAYIEIFYKGEELHKSNYLYNGSLDQVLAALNLGNSNAVTNASSLSNTYDVLEMISATGVRPVISSSRTAKRPKRLVHS
ncbi:unnamed protein product [Adineta ricciae]|uniref:Uncharacterized protein n=1 Tax=Adineta ricciae TaxID=249248 RepID=A0A814INF6_ADIRI|nr:unnamed protein product [Adineta ricciae]CAF1454481.1 unnamed protein product [Adineta ricciae]